ncbi:MAG: class I SAM-dependent methyltransferase [Clostridiaceae bacterium]
MDCYKEFAKIYDQLINCDIDYEAWAKFVLDICTVQFISFNDYLDLACGTGNMAEQICGRFKECWMVDMSQDMLSEAESKLRSRGIKARFICQDIKELKLNKQFDLITCCLDSTNYITRESDLLKYFTNVKQHLKEKGLFIFDINSYYKLKEILGNNVYNYDDEKVTYIWENSFNNEIADMYLTFFVKEGDLYRRFDEEHSERAYKDETIEGIINEAGLQLLYKFDNYELKQPDEETERIVYVLRKKGEDRNG